MNTWMVRAGKGARLFDIFQAEQLIAIGWSEIGDLMAKGAKTRSGIASLVESAFPSYKPQAVVMAAGQLYRFAHEFREGDRIVTYDSGARKYLCGIISGPYEFHPNADDEVLSNIRKVTWQHETNRDDLSQSARNSLGAISTLFEISSEVSAELWGRKPVHEVVETEEESDPFDPEALAIEKIKDQVAKLDWEQMQELVGGLLRAMGYKTKISPAGSDRGKDIVASPDGFGFEEPRIVVEVKHRPKERMSAPVVRSFVGGRHVRDKGLFVSTGGFTKDALYEAERATIPITLLDFDDLIDALLENYAELDESTRQLLPLKRMYWPIT